MLKKIAVIGPESTGKSHLCEQLAQHYRAAWVPEFARQYLLSHGMSYSFADLLTIAKGQVALEDDIAATTNAPVLFVDTEMNVMKVWCEFVFGNCHLWILNQVVERKYDLYLLCNTDLPWVRDDLREYPDLESRVKLYHTYKDILINQPVPWIEISGTYAERLQKAIAGVESIAGEEYLPEARE